MKKQKRVSSIRRRYTKVSKSGDKWKAYFVVGCQSFSVVENTSRKRAQWYGKMLSLAIENLLLEQQRDA